MTAGNVDWRPRPHRPPVSDWRTRGPRAYSGTMKIPTVLLALFLAVVAQAADSVPLFNATLTMGKEHRFVLIDAQGKTSSFLALGESFAGYLIKNYDAKTGVLELERNGRVHRVTLVADAAIKDGPTPVLPATIADAETVLNKMHFEEMMERALGQQRKMIAGQFQQVSAQMMKQGVDPAEAAAFQKKLTDEVLTVLDAKQLKGDVTKIYSEVFSKQELDQIGAFYSTPLGEMLSAKQPAAQEKLVAIIQGRMAEAMPRVQKMGVEFAAAQKAKREGGGAVPAPPKK